MKPYTKHGPASLQIQIIFHILCVIHVIERNGAYKNLLNCSMVVFVSGDQAWQINGWHGAIAKQSGLPAPILRNSYDMLELLRRMHKRLD